ncbi:MAG: HEAT repeat domain-containing protein [Euryarchaeota archaeon]|nr:HEAT repeat domain-containing protein [Euryarchaeota archaeon]
MTVEEQLICRLTTVGRADKVFAEETASEHQPRDRQFHVKHIRLDLGLDLAKRTIAGTSTLTLTPINDGLRAVDLDAVDLTIRGVRGEGKALPFDHRDGLLTVKLPRAYKAGEEFTLAVRYAGKPRKGLFFIGPDKDYPKKEPQVWTQGEAEDNKFWFPCYEAPNDRMTSDVLLTVPKGWVAVSNGRLVALREANGGRLFHWRQDVPHVNYLIALAAGRYEIVEEEWDGVPLQYYVPRGASKLVPLAFRETGNMMDFFSKVTGQQYPYPKYAQVVVTDATLGGMENTSMTTVIETTLHDERARPNYETEGLVSHELAHQWFGDYVTMKAWPHLWLNEGFADYFEELWYEHRFGKDMFQLRMMNEAQGYLEEDANNYRRAIVTTKFHSPEDMFDAHTYQKGACVLHMLRYVLGDPLWWKAIRHYVRKHGMQVVETNDFRLAIEEATGRSLDWFFNEWVHKAGHPEFEVSWAYDDAAKLVAVTVKQKQEVKDLTPLFRTPVEFLVANGKAAKREKVEITEKEQTFHIPLRAKPDMVLFDPDNWVLKKLTFEKSKEELLYQVEKGPTIAARVQACEGLGKILHDEKVIEAVRRALTKDTFWGVQRAAAKALGEIGTEEAKRVLLTHGVKHTEPRVRRGVAEALGKFREDDEALEALVRLYAKDPKYYVAASAGRAIAETRHPKALDAIKKGMDRRSHAEIITRLALAGIASLRDPEGIPVCKACAKRGKPTFVRMAATDALGKLGDYLENRRQEIREFLAPLLRDPQMHVRNATCGALAQLGDPAAIPELQKVAQYDIMGMTQRAARRAIRKIRDRQAEIGKKSEFAADVDKLKDDNLKLQQRLAKLESQLQAIVKKRK